MITVINQSKFIRIMRSHLNDVLKIAAEAERQKLTPIYPTPSGMNIKIPQNPYLEATRDALMTFHKEPEYQIRHFIPDGYTKCMGFYIVPEEKRNIMLTIAKKVVPAGSGNEMLDLKVKIGELITPWHFCKNNPEVQPHYFIDDLWSQGKNTGTNAIKSVVLVSLNDPQTQGRVLVDACKRGGEKLSPIGFYYKLGFRSVSEGVNEKCAKWLAEGGKKENAPLVGASLMYLPRENIQHCLNYGLDVKV